eukprot:10253438-Alexandrium_andersonii.AAC.1
MASDSMALDALEAIGCDGRDDADEALSADEALDRLDCLDSTPAGASTADRQRTVLARRVLTALRRRESTVSAEAAAAGDSSSSSATPTFTVLASDAKHTVDEINKLVFFRHSGNSLRM